MSKCKFLSLGAEKMKEFNKKNYFLQIYIEEIEIKAIKFCLVFFAVMLVGKRNGKKEHLKFQDWVGPWYFKEGTLNQEPLVHGVKMLF